MSRRTVAPACAAFALVVAALTACDTARPPACPGERVGTFRLRGDLLASDGSCPFVGDGGLSFTATVSFTGEGQAALCADRVEAAPMVGTRTGDHLTLSTPTTAASAPTCVCSVDVTETLEGDLQRSDGTVTGFTGALTDVLTVADGGVAGSAACEPDGGPNDAGPRCGVPCQVRWQLSTVR